jgi:hypothetical protein
MEQQREHWERVYATKQSEEVSWFQSEPRISLELLEDAGLRSAT